MKFQESKLPFLAMLSLVSLAGCEAPHGAHYNNAVYDSPSYDAVVYMPKYSPEFYDHNYYHNGAYGAR